MIHKILSHTYGIAWEGECSPIGDPYYILSKETKDPEVFRRIDNARKDLDCFNLAAGKFVTGDYWVCKAEELEE